MRRRMARGRKAAGALLMAMALWMGFSPTAAAVRELPRVYRLSVGQTQKIPLGAAVLSSQDETLLSLDKDTVAAIGAGETEMTVSLFGLINIGRVRVDVDDAVVLVPGGQAIGVAMTTKGVLVVGVSDVAGGSPAGSAGIRAGDVLLSINGQELTSAEHLITLAEQSGGRAMEIAYLREDMRRIASVTPVLSEGGYKLGVWARDSTAGVGTMSFYHPKTGAYGALGHAISDADTGRLLDVRSGRLMLAEITDVRKGMRGAPGELRGSFLRDRVELGSIEINSRYGVYGEMDAPLENALYPDGLPVAYQESVHTGKAQILSCIDYEGVKAYDVEILSHTRQPSRAQKSMVLRVTDQRLLEKTGGIVQGMSGSPIIQDGHIIGAVTHVFVDDPTRGYGLYIEWMLDTADGVGEKASYWKRDSANKAA